MQDHSHFTEGPTFCKLLSPPAPPLESPAPLELVPPWISVRARSRDPLSRATEAPVALVRSIPASSAVTCDCVWYFAKLVFAKPVFCKVANGFHSHCQHLPQHRRVVARHLLMPCQSSLYQHWPHLIIPKRHRFTYRLRTRL